MPTIKNKLGTYLFPALALAGVAAAEWGLDKGTKAAFDKAAYELNSPFEVYGSNLDSITAKVTEAFAQPEAKTGLLIINLPDNYKTFPEKVGHDIYDERKESMYQQLQTIPHTAFFALGTNNKQDSLSGTMMDKTIHAVARSPVDDIRIIITGHNTINEFAHGAFLSKNAEPERHLGKKCLSYEGVASLIAKRFKKANKNLSVFVMPCETQSFAENKDGCNPLAQLKKVNVYCAADTGQRSHPFDALRGFEKIMALSKKQGQPLNFHEMALLLCGAVTHAHADHYNPSFCTFENGKIKDAYNLNDLQEKIMNGDFTVAERAILTAGKPASLLDDQSKRIWKIKKNPGSERLMIKDHFWPDKIGETNYTYLQNFGPDPIRRAALHIRRLERQ